MLKKLALASLAVTSLAAHAADNGIYLGAGAGRSDFDVQLYPSRFIDTSDRGYKVIAGVRLLDSFGVELNYADHGSARRFPDPNIACIALVTGLPDCTDTIHLDAKTASAFAVGFLPLPFVDLFAKAGISRTDTSLRTLRPTVVPTRSETSTDVAWGGGAQAHLGSFAVRAVYERFEILDGRKLEVLSASLVYTFL